MAETTSSPPSPSDPAGRVRIVARTAAVVTETADSGELGSLLADPDARLWVDFTEPSAALVATAAEALGLHHLVAEDIVERNQRAKVETFDEDVIHMVLFALRYEGEVLTSEVDFVLGPRFLLTVHGPELDLAVLHTLRTGPGAVLARGPDFLLYALADGVVDGYFPVLDRLADEVDDLQDRVMADPSDWTLQRLFALKRELLLIRRATSPAREILNQLTNREVGVIAEAHVVYFRDVYDHLIRVTDELDNYRELVAGTLDIYVSIVNNNLSLIMKRLTGVTVILAGIGAVAGIFGMSEAGAAFAGGEAAGFWIVSVGIVVLTVGAAVVLRRIGWI